MGILNVEGVLGSDLDAFERKLLELKGKMTHPHFKEFIFTLSWMAWRGSMENGVRSEAEQAQWCLLVDLLNLDPENLPQFNPVIH